MATTAKTAFAFIGTGIACLFVFPFAQIHCEDFQVQPSEEQAPALDAETQKKLDDLVKNEDLLGIIKLWEEIGSMENWQLNSKMGRVLLSFPKEKFVPALLEGMKNDKFFVSLFSLNVLKRLKMKNAAEYLEGRIFPPELSDEKKKEAVALVPSLSSEDYDVRKATKEKLIAMGPGVEYVLVDYLKNNDPEIPNSCREIILSVRQNLDYLQLNALWELDADAARKVYVHILTTEKGLEYDFQTTKVALNCLGSCAGLKDTEVARPYLKTQYSEDAIKCLGEMKDAESIDAIIESLKGQEKAKWAAAAALGNIGDKRAVKALRDALEAETDMITNGHYMAALARLGDRQPLQDALKNADSHEICLIYYGAPNIGPEEMKIIAERLSGLDAAKQEDLSVAAAFLFHFFSFNITEGDIKGHPDAAAGLKKARANFENAFKALDASVEPEFRVIFSYLLIKCLDADEEKAIIAQVKDKDASKRCEAVIILGATKDKKYLPIFVEACEDDEPCTTFHEMTGSVSRIAINAITKISGEPFDIYLFDSKRQVAEIKAWHKKHLEQKAAAGKDDEQQKNSQP